MSNFPVAAFLTSAHRPAQFVPDDGHEVAFAGRSNAGKSSAINRILGRRDLARTSKTPGRTQLVNFFSLGEAERLVDLPGYGFARVPRELQAHWQTLIRDYLRRGSLTGLMLIVDVRRGILDGDERLLDWSAAVGCPVHVLLTKSDKLRRSEATASLKAARERIAGGASVQLFSALRGSGVDEARAALRALLRGERIAGAPPHDPVSG